LEQFRLTITASRQWVADGTVCIVDANDLQTMEESLSKQLGLAHLRVLAWDDDLETYCVPDSIAEIGPVATVSVCPASALEQQFGQSSDSVKPGDQDVFSSKPSAEPLHHKGDAMLHSLQSIRAELTQQPEPEPEQGEEADAVPALMSKPQRMKKPRRGQRRSYSISIKSGAASADFLQMVDEGEDDSDVPAGFVRVTVPPGMSARYISRPARSLDLPQLLTPCVDLAAFPSGCTTDLG